MLSAGTPAYGGGVQPVENPELEATVDIDASPEAVWALVADPTRTPEWSGVVKRSEWAGDPAEPVAGARFVGHNRFNGFRWSRECVVTQADAPRVFAFSTLDKLGEEQTRWRYRIEPAGPGCRVTLDYEVVSIPRWVWIARALPGGAKMSARQAKENVEGSVAHIKRLVESAIDRN